MLRSVNTTTYLSPAPAYNHLQVSGSNFCALLNKVYFKLKKPFSKGSLRPFPYKLPLISCFLSSLFL
jgi:hypothetical protein